MSIWNNKIEVDDGSKREYIILDSPEKGLYILKGIWRNMVWHYIVAGIEIALVVGFIYSISMLFNYIFIGKYLQF